MRITILQLKEKLGNIDWDVNVDALNDELPLTDQGLDSLDIIDMLLCIEGEFSLKISNEDVIQLKSLNDYVAYINLKFFYVR